MVILELGHVCLFALRPRDISLPGSRDVFALGHFELVTIESVEGEATEHFTPGTL